MFGNLPSKFQDELSPTRAKTRDIIIDKIDKIDNLSLISDSGSVILYNITPSFLYTLY